MEVLTIESDRSLGERGRFLWAEVRESDYVALSSPSLPQTALITHDRIDLLSSIALGSRR
jgi:hypothetical protein